jgi:ribosomal-protein-alanine N-acetyltransferase
MTIPTLETDRLLLRPFTLADAPEVRRLCGAREVYEGTLSIPHPYTQGHAEEWIGEHAEAFERREFLSLAVTRRSDGALVGSMGLGFAPAHARAELGYWIGVPYWGQGFATEAAAELIRYGFEELGLERVNAHHFPENPASGRVLEKLGMTREGRLRGHVVKDGRRRDVVAYGLLRGN